MAFLGHFEIHSIPERILFFLQPLGSAGFGFDPVKTHTIYCVGVQHFFAFFGVFTAAEREVNWRQAIHVAFAAVILGSGQGSTRAQRSFCIGHGLGGVERTAISFWRRGLGGWLLVFISVRVQHRTFRGMGRDLQTGIRLSGTQLDRRKDWD